MLNFLFEKTPFNYLIQSFWRDEAFSYLLAKKNIFQIISLSVQDFSPPLYPLLLKIWMFVFGSSEVALRSLSFVAYLGIYYFFYNFLVKIFKVDKTWTTIYSILFFVNPFLNYYAFEARGYSLYALLTIASFYYFLTRKKVPYLAITVLGLYTHYFMIFVPIVQAIALLIGKFAKNEKTEWLRNIAKAFLFFVPWILFFIFENRVADDSFWIDPPTFKTLQRLPSILYLGFEGNFQFFKQQVGKFSAFLYLFIIGGSLVVWKNRKNRDLLSMLLVWAFLPAFAVFLISFIKPVFFPRYLILAAPGILLLLVFLLHHLGDYLKIVLVVLLIFFTFRYNNLQVEHRKKAPIRKVVREIKTQADKDDLIYVTDILVFHPFQYYFGEDRVYIFNKSYEEIPAYVGKVLIPKEKIVSSIPFYPKRAFIITGETKYFVQAVY